MIIAEFVMGTLFNESRETSDGIGIYFEDPLKQEQISLCQGGTFELDSIQIFFDQDTKQNLYRIVKNCLTS